ATAGLVNCWHTLNDTSGSRQIIAGLTEEILDRVEPAETRGKHHADSHFFNPNELKTELDMLCAENGVKVMLHTLYCSVVREGGKIGYVIVENKDGRGAVRASFFIDSSGDGDVCRDLGIGKFYNETIQPPSACFLLEGDVSHVDVSRLIRHHGDEFGLEKDWGWFCRVPDASNITMRADTHVLGVIPDKAADLTKAETEGRRKMRAVVKMLNKYGAEGVRYANVNSCSSIGVRETAHYVTAKKADQFELLLGKRYDDCVLNGTYNVDVHLPDGSITFRHFDGSYNTEFAGGGRITGSWRQELGIDEDLPIPTYYSLPFSTLVPLDFDNFIAVGRMINADMYSFGALRVMVNLNQLGEAAGVAAYLSIDSGTSVRKLDGREVARKLSDGGSANLQ
nr:FAD-dependent oxidoreductase [Clostridiales bacterium]